MAKIVFMRFAKNDPQVIKEALFKINRAFDTFDVAFQVTPLKSFQNDGRSILGIYNPAPSYKMEGVNLKVQQGTTDATRLLSIYTDSNGLQIQSGAFGYPVHWYYHDSDVFVFSNSQFLINRILGKGIELNEQAVQWMIATGSTAYQPWDKRSKCFSIGSQIYIDQNHTIKHTQKSFPKYGIDKGSFDLKEVVIQAMGEYNLSADSSLLTLSGGLDSRVLLSFFAEKGLRRTGSWGLIDAEAREGTDSYIASQLATHVGINYQHFDFDVNNLHPDRLLLKLILAGDLRVDHVNQFIDGLAFYGNLYSAGVKTVIRGDEPFGWVRTSNEFDTMLSVGFNQINSFSNIPSKLIAFKNDLQLPSPLRRIENETLPSWRDRLYCSFRLPYVLTGLIDQMHPFIDVVNPFLHADIINCVRSLKDEQRNDKNHFRKQFDSVYNNIPYARYPSVPEPELLMKHPVFYEYLQAKIKGLSFTDGLEYWDENFLSKNLVKQAELDNEYLLAHKRGYNISKYLPFWVKKKLRNNFKGYALDYGRLALRLCIVQEIIENFDKDQ